MEIAAAELLLAQMSARSHVAPKWLVSPGPNEKQLEQIFLAAAQAPDHGLIQPWRFIIVPLDKREDLGQAFVKAHKERDTYVTNDELKKTQEKALHAPCLLMAVVNQESTEPQIPINERMISLGCAIQNMLLLAQSLSFGSGIVSGKAIDHRSLRHLFGLRPIEVGVCFVAFGTVIQRKPLRHRPNVTSFVTSL